MSSIDRAPVFIVFEGLDGAGKTTLAHRTAAALGVEVMTTPSPSVRRYRDELVAGFAGSQEAAQLFYLATVFAASREVRARLDAGQSVVLDRYFLSTQAYAAFRGSALGLDELSALLVPADLTVFVHASLAIRVGRIARRGASAADQETMTAAADQRLRAEHVARFALPVVGRVVHLDNSVEAVEVLVAKIRAMVLAWVAR